MTLTVSGTLPRGVRKASLVRAVREAFRAARRAERGAIAVRFVSDAEMKALNRRYLGKNRPTDVLAFQGAGSREQGTKKEWGDILIASQYARREAKRRGVAFSEEIMRLVTHGTLHLLGYDHATAKDEKRMFDVQEKVVERVCLPS